MRPPTQRRWQEIFAIPDNPMSATQAPTQPFDQLAREMRSHIQELAHHVQDLHNHSGTYTQDPAYPGRDHTEIHDNITLAYRHLEDARMRLGKAIQAFDGGVSVYDK
jgi:hypothetical protein